MKDWYFSPETSLQEKVCTREVMLRPGGVSGVLVDGVIDGWIRGDEFAKEA